MCNFMRFVDPSTVQIINTFWVHPHSDLLQNVPVKPKNRNISKLLKNGWEFSSDLTLTHG